MKRILVIASVAVCFALTACRPEPEALRIGYSGTLSQAAALFGVGSGRFSEIGGVPARVSSYSGGPSTIEAMLAGDLDVAYVDPVPALSAFARTRGGIVIVAGAASGGAALVASRDSQATKASDLSSARVAVSEAGSTQDVAARTYFGGIGFASYEHGGNFRIVYVPGSDLKEMFESDQIEAAWTVEPWVTQLRSEAKAPLILDEASLWNVNASTIAYPTAVVIARVSLLRHDPSVLRDFLKVHAEITRTLAEGSDETLSLVTTQLSKLTHQNFAAGVIRQAWGRLQFSTDVSLEALKRDAADAVRVGFLTPEPLDFSRVVDRHLLKDETTPHGRS